jgi:hypothetical protein
MPDPDHRGKPWLQGNDIDMVMGQVFGDWIGRVAAAR